MAVAPPSGGRVMEGGGIWGGSAGVTGFKEFKR